MLVIPAIDLKDGQAVRLFKGDYQQKTVYSDHPEELAQTFEEAGAKLLHVVDLDGAKDGQAKNLETIKKEIEQRDYQDMHRAISPLKKADDAIELDTSNMTLEEVVDQVLTLINKTREE